MVAEEKWFKLLVPEMATPGGKLRYRTELRLQSHKLERMAACRAGGCAFTHGGARLVRHFINPEISPNKFLTTILFAWLAAARLAAALRESHADL